MERKCHNCRHYHDGYCQASDKETKPNNSCEEYEEI